MSRCLVKIQHNSDSCRSVEGKPLQVYENDDGSVSGYCFKCNTYIPDPLGNNPDLSAIPQPPPKKTVEEIQEEIDSISTLKSLDLDCRQLKEGALEYYGIKVGYSEEDGKTPAFVHFPYTKKGQIVRYKTRLLQTKRMWSVSLDKDVDLFGWEQAKNTGARRLIITEGEFDAVALTKILRIHTKSDYKDTIPAVVSLPNGAGGAVKDIQRCIVDIRKFFGSISLCFDQDDAGREAVDAVCKLFPDFKTINLPGKDANYCLMNGMSLGAFKAVTFQADTHKNTKLVWGRDVHEGGKQPPKWGLSWPWGGMTDLTRGIRFGESIYIAAAEKMGKSSVLNAIAKHLIIEHNLLIMLAKPEEANVKTHKLLAGQVAGKIFHDPKIEFDLEAYEEAGKRIQDRYCMLDLYQNITWPLLQADIYSAVSQGVKAVFIDPITNLTNGMSSGESNEFLQGFAQDVAALSKDLDIISFLFCHLNKPPKGTTPFDRGGKITTDFFAGSSAMARSCNYAIGLQGNKDPELPEHERNLRELVILADREYGEVGGVKLYWDNKTGLFNEVRG